jgi:hypothetical protein
MCIHDTPHGIVAQIYNPRWCLTVLFVHKPHIVVATVAHPLLSQSQLHAPSVQHQRYDTGSCPRRRLKDANHAEVYLNFGDDNVSILQ